MILKAQIVSFSLLSTSVTWSNATIFIDTCDFPFNFNFLFLLSDANQKLFYLFYLETLSTQKKYIFKRQRKCWSHISVSLNKKSSFSWPTKSSQTSKSDKVCSLLSFYSKLNLIAILIASFYCSRDIRAAVSRFLARFRRLAACYSFRR